MSPSDPARIGHGTGGDNLRPARPERNRMQWIAPSERDIDAQALENRLWAAADQLRANSGLTSAQYSQPVLGLIFLRFAEVRFLSCRAVLEKKTAGGRRGSRVDDPIAYQAEGILYLTPQARFDNLLRLPEGSDAGKAVNEAMRDIEAKNPQLAGALPKTYQIFDSTLLKDLLKKVSEIPATTEGDTFGRIYEYFLGEFARTEGSRGGEFYTPHSIVRLLVEVLEPFHGRILDPACGSGGMFVQSARFVTEHRKSPATELAIHGQEKVGDTVRLCRMNLAVHGLEGDIGLDPVWWTQSERRIRCPQWQTREQSERDGASPRTTRPGPSDWSSMKAKRSRRSRATWA